MNEENQLLVTNEQVEFEKKPVDIPSSKKITDHFGGIYRKSLYFNKEELKDGNM